MINIEKDLNLTPQNVGYITGIFFLSYSLFQIPAGWLNDRIGYKKVLLLSLITISGCAFLFGFVGTTISLLITFRFLAGVGHSGYPCSCAKAVSSNFSIDERTLAQSILLSSSGVAMVVGPIVVSYTLSSIGWRWTYIDLAIIAMIVVLFIFLWVPNLNKQDAVNIADNSPKISYFSLLKNPVVILLFIAIFGVNIPAYGLMVWLPKYLIQVRGLELEWAAYMIAIGGVTQWISSIGTGWIVGKYFKSKEKYVIFISSLISAICIWLAYISNTILLCILSLCIAYIFLMSSFITIFTLPMKWLPPNIIGSAMGLVNTGGTLGGFVSPIVIGILLSTNNTMSGNFSYAFMFLASGMLLSALIVLPLKKPQN